MTEHLAGLLLCSRYSYAPNSLHYCGPEKQTDMNAYVSEGIVDQGLAEILDKFETLYPYLRLIAAENRIRDPFDPRVVEAYWVGNALLQNVRPRQFAEHLSDTLDLKKKIPSGALYPMLDRVLTGLPHHTHHVLNIFIRTGHAALIHTLDTMDQCRISWGKVIAPAPYEGGVRWKVALRPLISQRTQIQLGKPEMRIVSTIGVAPKIGDWVSVHWSVICDIISVEQRRQLAKYTAMAIRIANRSL